MRARALAVAALAAALGAPAAGQEEGARVVLRWAPVQGAAGYDLQVSAEPSFATRELELRVALAGYRMGPPPAARRYWRVRSVDADGRAGPWSPTKTIEPSRNAPEPPPPPVEEPPFLAVAPRAAPLGPEEPAGAPAPPDTALGGAVGAPAEPFNPGDWGFEGIAVPGVLRDGRPGAIAGWRSGLLDAGSPEVAIEGAFPLPWLGREWSVALRAGWWRKRQTLPAAEPGYSARADVFPLGVLVFRSFPRDWARVYAGVGLGADLVLVSIPHQGALEASAAVTALAGAGRPLGPGELFLELGGSLGGVDGPLARLRTGGISLSLGYRLGR